MSAKIIIGCNIRPNQKPGGMTAKGNRRAVWSWALGGNRTGELGLGHRSKTGWACQRPTAWESTQDPRHPSKGSPMPPTDNSLNSISIDRMQAICRAIHSELPDHCGFIVITVPFGDGTTPSQPNADYAANIRREDAVAALKVLLWRWGVDEKWMESTK